MFSLEKNIRVLLVRLYVGPSTGILCFSLVSNGLRQTLAASCGDTRTFQKTALLFSLIRSSLLAAKGGWIRERIFSRSFILKSTFRSIFVGFFHLLISLILVRVISPTKIRRLTVRYSNSENISTVKVGNILSVPRRKLFAGTIYWRFVFPPRKVHFLSSHSPHIKLASLCPKSGRIPPARP